MLSSLTLAAAALLSVTPVFSAPTNLEERAVANCKGAFQCRKFVRPANSAATCVSNMCSYSCNAGYTSKQGRCVSSSSTTSSPTSSTATATYYIATTTTAAAATATTSTTTNLTANAVIDAGVTAFSGNNTNAVISWFRTNNTADSTNGHSWCGYPYNDAVPGFAPSLKTMKANFGGNSSTWEEVGKAFCGLEAIVTTPSGRNTTLYITDAFDDTWVLTPSSIDVIVSSFPLLYGSTTTDKNDVVVGGSWALTGNRYEKYAFKSATSLD